MTSVRICMLILGFALLSVQFGCGSGTSESYDPTREEVVNSIRSILTEVEKTGEKGSAYMALPDEIARLRELDPAKADSVEAEYQKLEQTQDRSEIKSLAKEALADL